MQLPKELLREAELLCVPVTQGQPGCGGGRAPSSAQDTMEGTHCRMTCRGFAALGPVINNLLDRDMAFSERSWGRYTIQVLCSGGLGASGKKREAREEAPPLCYCSRGVPGIAQLSQEAWGDMFKNASVL